MSLGLHESQFNVDHYGSYEDALVKLNSPSRLAPIDMWLLVNIDGEMVKAKRTKLVEKDGTMEYMLDDGEIIKGQFWWAYL